MRDSGNPSKGSSQFSFTIAPVPHERADVAMDFPKIDMEMLPPLSLARADRAAADILKEDYADTVGSHQDAIEGVVMTEHLEPEMLRMTFPSQHVTFVPAGRVVQGNVTGPAVVVAGRVEGKVVAQSGPVIVLHGGRVDGTVGSPGMVVIAGDVHSHGLAVACGGQLIVGESARVSGRMKFMEIAVYQGAKIRVVQ